MRRTGLAALGALCFVALATTIVRGQLTDAELEQLREHIRGVDIRIQIVDSELERMRTEKKTEEQVEAENLARMQRAVIDALSWNFTEEGLRAALLDNTRTYNVRNWQEEWELRKLELSRLRLQQERDLVETTIERGGSMLSFIETAPEPAQAGAQTSGTQTIDATVGPPQPSLQELLFYISVKAIEQHLKNPSPRAPAATTTSAIVPPRESGLLNVPALAQGAANASTDASSEQIQFTNLRLDTAFVSNVSMSNPQFVLNAPPETRVQRMVIGDVTDDRLLAMTPGAPEPMAPGPFAWLARLLSGAQSLAARTLSPRGSWLTGSSSSISMLRPARTSTAWNLQSSSGGSRNATGTGVKLFLTSLGESTGRAFRVVAVNEGSQPVDLELDGLVLEPLARVSQTQIAQEIARFTSAGQTTATLNAYCLEFLKLPPTAGMAFRVAARTTQRQYDAVVPVLDAARTLREQGRLGGGSSESYFHATRQWALWTLEQKFDEAGFGRAFVEHARKNYAAARRQWTADVEAAARAQLPIRWQDIQLVIRTARERQP